MEKKRDSFFLNKKPKPDNKGKQKHNKRQEEFDRNRQVKPDQENEVTEKKQNTAIEKKENGAAEKKPFDKKAYRLKKYSKKYKLDQWEEQRKKRLVNNYQKELKHETVSGTYKPISFDEDVTDGSVGKYVRHPDILEKENSEKENLAKTKKDPFHKAKEQYKKIKHDKEQKQLEIERVKQERTEKLLEYKKKKHDRFKKLSKKTKRGQPVMTGRLELLLEKIQSK